MAFVATVDRARCGARDRVDTSHALDRTDDARAQWVSIGLGGRRLAVSSAAFSHTRHESFAARAPSGEFPVAPPSRSRGSRSAHCGCRLDAHARPRAREHLGPLRRARRPPRCSVHRSLARSSLRACCVDGRERTPTVGCGFAHSDGRKRPPTVARGPGFGRRRARIARDATAHDKRTKWIRESEAEARTGPNEAYRKAFPRERRAKTDTKKGARDLGRRRPRPEAAPPIGTLKPRGLKESRRARSRGSSCRPRETHDG
jgi:hypothetical protein